MARAELTTEKNFGCANYPIHQPVFQSPHHPWREEMTTSIMEASVITPTKVTNTLKPFHHHKWIMLSNSSIMARSLAVLTQILIHQEPFGDIDFVSPKARLFSMRTSLYIFEDNVAVMKQRKKGRSLAMRHVSRTHRVDLDRLHDRINPAAMIQITHVRKPQSAMDTLTQKGSSSGIRGAQLTLLVNIMTHTTFTQSNVSVSSEVVNPLFSSMSKRARESFAASACAKQKPVHCSGLIARKISDKNGDMDCHAVPPPEYRAGGDSKREDLCQHDSERVNKTTPGAPNSGRQVAAEDPSNTCERKVDLQPHTEGEKYIKTSKGLR